MSWIRFICSTPSRVCTDSNAWCKIPEHSRKLRLIRYSCTNLIHQLFVICCSQSDVVRKDSGSPAVVDAVNIVLSVYERYSRIGRKCLFLVRQNQFSPFAAVKIGRVTLTEDGSEIASAFPITVQHSMTTVITANIKIIFITSEPRFLCILIYLLYAFSTNQRTTQTSMSYIKRIF